MTLKNLLDIVKEEMAILPENTKVTYHKVPGTGYCISARNGSLRPLTGCVEYSWAQPFCVYAITGEDHVRSKIRSELARQTWLHDGRSVQ